MAVTPQDDFDDEMFGSATEDNEPLMPAPVLPPAAKTPSAIIDLDMPPWEMAKQKAAPKPRSTYGFNPDVESAIDDAAKMHGFDPDIARTFVKIESGGDPRKRTGSYNGLLMLSQDDFRKFGGGDNIYDPVQNARAGILKLKSLETDFEKTHGRKPTASEIYFSHQQGQGGADAHWRNPDAPAWENMYRTAEGRKKGPNWAKQAIWGNLPDSEKRRFGSVENLTSRDFTDFWDRRVRELSGQNDPVQVAQAPRQTVVDIDVPPWELAKRKAAPAPAADIPPWEAAKKAAQPAGPDPLIAVRERKDAVEAEIRGIRQQMEADPANRNSYLPTLEDAGKRWKKIEEEEKIARQSSPDAAATRGWLKYIPSVAAQVLFRDWGRLTPGEAKAELRTRLEEAPNEIKKWEDSLKELADYKAGRLKDPERVRALAELEQHSTFLPKYAHLKGHAILEAQYKDYLAEEKLKYKALKDIEAGLKPGFTKTATRAGVDNFATGVADVVASIPKFAGIASSYLGIGTPNPEESHLVKFGEWIQEKTKDLLPGDMAREQQQDFAQKLAQGAGSMVGFIGPGAAMRVLGIAGKYGSLGTTLVSGGAAQGVEVFDEATDAIRQVKTIKDPETGKPIKFTPDEKDRMIASGWGFLLGLTEAAPIERALGRPSGRELRKILAAGRVGATEEGAQELFQTIGSNVVAKNYYDPTRDPFEGAGDAALIGSILGFKMGAGKATIDAWKYRHQEAVDPADQQKADAAFAEYLRGALGRGEIAEGDIKGVRAEVQKTRPAFVPQFDAIVNEWKGGGRVELDAARTRIDTRSTPPPLPDEAAPEAQPMSLPEAPETAAAPPTPEEMSVLRRMGYTAVDIRDMEPEQRAAEMEDAKSRGIVPDVPSAEPIQDIVAQARDLADPDNQRTGLYLSPDNVRQIQENPEFIDQIADALRNKGELVENVDGNGGVLLAKDAATAKAVRAAIESGQDIQQILGQVTGAGQGKPADATAVVQQVTPEGAVTRESAVAEGDIEKNLAEFRKGGREARVVTPEEALGRREQGRTTPPPLPTEQVGDGSRQAPVRVETPEDIARAEQRVAEPTDGQRDAGNYKHGHLKFQGLDITIENPKGSIRRGTSPDGTPWQVVMPTTYGYLKRSVGRDGDQVDVYVGPNPKSDRVFIIDQVDPDTGKFDEHKGMLGYNTISAARFDYEQAFSDGRALERMGGVTEMTVAKFKDWLAKGKRTRPLSKLDEKPDAVAEQPTETHQEQADKLPDNLTDAERETLVKAWRYVNAIEQARAQGRDIQQQRLDIANELDADLASYGIEFDNFADEQSLREYLSGSRGTDQAGNAVVEAPQATEAEAPVAEGSGRAGSPAPEVVQREQADRGREGDGAGQRADQQPGGVVDNRKRYEFLRDELDDAEAKIAAGTAALDAAEKSINSTSLTEAEYDALLESLAPATDATVLTEFIESIPDIARESIDIVRRDAPQDVRRTVEPIYREIETRAKKVAGSLRKLKDRLDQFLEQISIPDEEDVVGPSDSTPADPYATGKDVARDHVLTNGRKTGTEHGMVVMADGSTKPVTPSERNSKSYLEVSAKTAPDLYDGPAKSADLHHNHPKSSSFSRADYTEAAVRPALRRTWVHGHDGSEYWASFKTNDPAILGKAYDIAMAVTERLTEKGYDLPRYRTHMIATMMRDGGVIEYGATLTPARADERIATLREKFGEDAIAKAVEDIRNLLGGQDVYDRRPGSARSDRDVGSASARVDETRPEAPGSEAVGERGQAQDRGNEAEQVSAFDRATAEAKAYVLRKGKESGIKEFGATVRPNGELIIAATGGGTMDRFIEINPEKTPELYQDQQRVLEFHHNHPSSNSFSRVDLSFGTSLKSLKTLYAHGHDGSTYAADFLLDAGRSNDVASAANAVHDAIWRAIDPSVVDGSVDRATVNYYFNHLVTQALADAGAVEYRPQFSKTDADASIAHLMRKIGAANWRRIVATAKETIGETDRRTEPVRDRGGVAPASRQPEEGGSEGARSPKSDQGSRANDRGNEGGQVEPQFQAEAELESLIDDVITKQFARKGKETTGPLKIGSGDILRSQSGREMSPAPNIDVTTSGRATNSIKRMNAWLHSEAIKEVDARPAGRRDILGNDAEKAQLRTVLDGIDPKKATQSDQDTLNDIVFGSPEGATEANLVRRRGEKPSARKAAKAAGSAARNVIKGMDEVATGLATLFGAKSTRVGSGPSFDEDTYRKAVPFFKSGISHFSKAGSDIKTAVRELVSYLADTAGMSKATILDMKPYLVRFVRDIQTGEIDPAKGDDNAPDSRQGVERDRGTGRSEDSLGQARVPDERIPDGSGAQPRDGKAGKDTAPARGGSVPDGDAAAVGTGRDRGVSGRAPRDERGPAGSDRGGRGSDAGVEGVPAGRVAAEAVSGTARRAPSLKEALAAQKEADATVPFELNDPDNIRAALPALKPAQQDDVVKAEARFSQPEGHGFLLTNGTGTGKTWSGLGVVKRFVKQGKSNILIVAPSQGILDGWIDTGRMLGVEIARLPDTKTAGKGIVATTYANLGDNETLADRNWDLIVADEAHKLSQNEAGSPTDALHVLRGLTNKDPYGRARMKLAPEFAKLKELEAAAKANQSLRKKYEEANTGYFQKVSDLRDELAKEPRAKALFLSATPFAYRKSTDYAEGFLFDYPELTGRYNSPGGQSEFLQRNFGYAIRYNRAEEPGPEVNVGVLEREFYERLKREGVLSGRRLEVEADYDRRFVLVDDAVGAKIDQAMNWLSSERQGRYLPLFENILETFNYLAQRRLLEAIKAKHVVPRIKRDLELGRKVVVFHDYNEGGGFAPFAPPSNPNERVRPAYGEKEGPTIGELYSEFIKANPYVKTLDFAQFKSPIETLTTAFPEALVYNGRIPNKQRSRARDEFNLDGSGRDIIIVQSAAGEAGISLHDTTGKHQRVLYNLGLPTRPTTAIQQEGRIYREGQVSDAILRYMSTGTGWERTAFSQTIAERASTAENLALGDEARALRDSFIDSFNDADDIPQGADEGRGGKAKDRTMAGTVSPYDKAKAFYFAEGKKRGRRDQREGADYYATPEPIGLKMVEFADVQIGERILEPSAGHGAIARWFPEGANRVLIEPSSNLASRAGLASPGAKVITSRFEDHYIGNKYDAIVMNPPFGVGGKDALDHVQKAVGHLREGGRVVAILPRGPAADKRLEAFRDSDVNKNIYAALEIDLPPVMFERAGTKVATRLVVFERHSEPSTAPNTAYRDLSDAETINELFDRMENLSLSARRRENQSPAGQVPADVVEPPRQPVAPSTAEVSFKLGETKHSRTGADLYVASIAKQVPRTTFDNLLATAKKHKGYYSSFRGSGAIPGFQFPTEENRTAFLQAINGGMREEADQEDFPRVNKDGYILALPYEKEWGNPRFIKADRERAIARLREIQSINADEVPWADLVDAKRDIEQIIANLFYYKPEIIEQWKEGKGEFTFRGEPSSLDLWLYLDELDNGPYWQNRAENGARQSIFSDKNVPADLAEFADEGGQAIDSLLDSKRKGLLSLLKYDDETDPVKPKKEKPVGAIGDKMPSGFYFKAARKIDEARETLFQMSGQSVINWLMKEGVSRAEINHFRLWDKFGGTAKFTREQFKQAIGERMFDFRRKMSWLNPERSKRDYELGGTRAFTGPRVPGQGIYFERPIAFPKKLAGGTPFPPGQFESPHWYNVLQNAWASWRGSIREVPGFGKMLVGEEGQSDYMQGASTGRRPKITEQEFLALKEARPKYKKVMGWAEDFLLRAIGSGSMADRGTPIWDLRIMLGNDLVPTDNGNELPRPAWDKAIELARKYVKEHRQLYLGESLVALDKLVALRTNYEEFFAPGARAKYDVDLSKRTPESPIDENYVRVMARDLLLLAAEKNVDSISVSTSSTTARIQNNPRAAHFYDQQMKPALERELRKLTGQWGLSLQKVALPKAMGSPKSERAYTVWAAKLDPKTLEKIRSEGQPVFSITALGTHDARVIAGIERRLKANRPATINPDAVDAALDAVQPDMDLVPPGTVVAAISKIEPDALNKDHVLVRAQRPDGSTVSARMRWDTVKESRSIFLPGRRPAVLIINFGTADRDRAGQKSAGGLVGEVSKKLILADIIRADFRHEVIHLLRSTGALDGARWDRLLSHANALRLLDLDITIPASQRLLARELGAEPNQTVGDAYTVRYANYSDPQELIDQEAVASLMELSWLGALTDADVAPVRDILDDIAKGNLRGTRPADGVGPLSSLREIDAAIGQSMRRDLDNLGFYSKALEAAKSLKQEKGTPEQMLAQLKKAGVKDAEIEATGLATLFKEKAGSSTALESDAITLSQNEKAPSRSGKFFTTEKGVDIWINPSPSQITRLINKHDTLRVTVAPDGVDFIVWDGSAATHQLANDVGFERGYDFKLGAYHMPGGEIGRPKLDTSRQLQIDHDNRGGGGRLAAWYDRIKATGAWRRTLSHFDLISQWDKSGTPALRQGDRTDSPPRRARLNQISKSEIVKYLEENRVGLREVERGRPLTPADKASIVARHEAAKRAVEAARVELRNHANGSPGQAEAFNALSRATDLLQVADRELSGSKAGIVPTTYSKYSLDPSNPTYRETVIHLSDEDIARSGYDFVDSHFPQERGTVGHTMSSLVKHNGKVVYLLDQIQSTGGQKLRDDGVRDEAKIAELKKRIADTQAEADRLLPLARTDAAATIDQSRAEPDLRANWATEPPRTLALAIRDWMDDGAKPGPDALAFVRAMEQLRLLQAEHLTAEVSVPGHPLVNTTDQWTQTTLRRAIRQAVEAGAQYIAIPSGETVLSYNPGDRSGMRGFYGGKANPVEADAIDAAKHAPEDIEGDRADAASLRKDIEGIVPKNLRKLLKGIDPAAPAPQRIDTLETPSGMKGEGFTLFPLTEKVRTSVLEDGQPMFSMVPSAKSAVPANTKDISRDITEAISIITRMTGRDAVQVEFRNQISGLEANPAQLAASRAAGFDTRTAGGLYKRPTLDAKALITLATNDPAYDLRTAAGHEAFHHVEEVLANPAEKRLLTSDSEMRRMRTLASDEIMGAPKTVLDRLHRRLTGDGMLMAPSQIADPIERLKYEKEIRTVAFQRYRRMREEGLANASRLHIGIRRLFDRIIQIFQGVRNVLKGYGYDSYEAIFERARTGEMADPVARRASDRPVRTLRNLIDPQMRPEGYVEREPFDLKNVRLVGRAMASVPLDAIRTIQKSVSIGSVRAKLGLPESDDGRPVSVFKYGNTYYVNDGNHRIEAMRINGAKTIRAEIIEIAPKDGDVEVLADRGPADVQAQPVGAQEDNQGAKAGLSDSDVQASLIPAAARAYTARWLRRLQPSTDAIRVYLQDKVLPIRRQEEAIEAASGIKLPEHLSVYTAEAIYHGRAGERLTDLQDKHVEPLIQHLRRSNISFGELGDYLYARHALERNDAIRQIDPTNDAGSGMTDAEANGIVGMIEQGSRAQGFKTAAGMIDAMIKDARDTLYRAGNLTKEQYDNWTTKYKSYVPLRGFEGEVEEFGIPRVGRGMDIRGPESMQALGRRSKADNPATYVIQQSVQAIIRSEKNRVDKTLYRLIQAHPNPDVWRVFRGEAKRRINPQTGLVEMYWVPPAFAARNKDNVFGVKIAGKQHYMEILHEPLARSLRTAQPGLLGTAPGRAFYSLARFYAQLVTSFNPEFVISNYLRDIQTALMNVGDVANAPPDVRKRIRNEALSFKSIRGVMAALQSHEGRTIFGGQRAADENMLGRKRSAAAQDYAKWFEEYRLAGGKISFIEMNDIDRIKNRVEKSISEGKTRRALRNVFDLIDNANSAVENGVRLSAYIALRKNGVSQDKAAFAARELTVNFNRKGEYGPGINAFYLFFNASVQGSTRLVQALTRSPAVRKGAASIVLAGALLDLLNYSIAGIDDDDENAYEKIDDWKKEKNMIVMLPGRKDYVQIPMPYGYNVLYLFGQKMAALFRTAAGAGKEKPAKAIAGLLGAMVESFSPMGAAPSWLQMASPTLLDPFTQIAENKSWFGGKIAPEKLPTQKHKPNSEMFFSTAPAWAIDLARALNRIGIPGVAPGGSTVKSGPIDVSPESIEHMAEFLMGGVGKFIGNIWNTGQRAYNDQEWIPEKTPFVRRVYGKATSESRRRDFYEKWNEVDAAHFQLETYRKAKDFEGMKRVREETPAELAAYEAMRNAQRQVSALRKQGDAINLNRDIDAVEKEKRLKLLMERENEIILRALKTYSRLKKDKTPKE